MLFKNIVGKQSEKNFLRRQSDESRIPHAQLFLGPEGSGNLALALAYASYIYCENKIEGDSCGQCKSCIQSHKFIHPDIHFSFPVIKSESKTRDQTTSDDFIKPWRQILLENPFFTISDWQEAIQAGNTKPNINTKECQDIIGKLSYQSYTGGPKILVLWLPEYLGKEGNKLLKLIEEPTDNTYIFLIAEDSTKILATILSRCQLVKIKPFAKEEIREALKTTILYGSENIEQIIQLSKGNINKAMKLSQGSDKNYSEALFDWLRACYKSDALEIQEKVGLIQSLTTDQQIQFLEYSLHFFREFTFMLLSGLPSTNLKKEEIEIAQKMNKLLDVEKVSQLVNIFNDSINNIARNVNIRINFTADSILIGNIMKNNVQPNYLLDAYTI